MIRSHMKNLTKQKSKMKISSYYGVLGFWGFGVLGIPIRK